MNKKMVIKKDEIKAIRTAMNMTQTEFAVYLMVSLPTVSLWERGKTSMHQRNRNELLKLKKRYLK